jgi:hypothetical protein
MVSTPSHRRAPIVYKVPEWQTATLFVLAAVLLFLALYVNLGLFVRILAGMLSLILIVAGIVAVRSYLVADDQGIGTRGLLSEQSVHWDDLDNIRVVGHHGALTLRIVRSDRTEFDVRPALVLPLKPISTQKARVRLEEMARELRRRAPTR